jgi:hypothetical protein
LICHFAAQFHLFIRQQRTGGANGILQQLRLNHLRLHRQELPLVACGCCAAGIFAKNQELRKRQRDQKYCQNQNPLAVFGLKRHIPNPYFLVI